MKIFLVAFIYRYALISVIGDKDIGDNIESLVTKLSSSLSQSSNESYTEGRPGVTWHLSNRLSCLYL